MSSLSKKTFIEKKRQHSFKIFVYSDVGEIEFIATINSLTNARRKETPCNLWQTYRDIQYKQLMS